MLDAKDTALLQKQLPFFNTLSAADKAQLLEGTNNAFYAQGDIVHGPAKECVGVLLVKRGELRTYILSEGGKEVTLFRLDAGEICVLSASCLLRSITFDVYIDAQQDTEVLLIHAPTFATLQAHSLEVENFALRIAAERFSDVVWAMEQILFMRFDTRLAVFLLDEAAKRGEDTLSLTHEQIAKYMGSAREVVSRMLNYFVKEGLVTLYRGGVTLKNKPALRALSQAKSK